MTVYKYGILKRAPQPNSHIFIQLYIIFCPAFFFGKKSQRDLDGVVILSLIKL